MVATVYFVNWYLHNKENDGWAYKVDRKYDTIDQAKKAYHTQLSNYIDSAVYDQVAVTFSNPNGASEMVESWSAPEEPNA
jgi:hypothetical protein